MKPDPTTITGLTLIDKALEFERMTPDKSEWAFEKQKDNPPRFIRLQQINALLNFFTPEIFDNVNIDSGLENFFKGQFIVHREAEKYIDVFVEMFNMLQTKYPSPKAPFVPSVGIIKYHFSRIVRFKKILNTLIEFNSGGFEASLRFQYSILLTEEFVKKLDTTLIDNFLSLVIDPLGRTVTKDELVQNYNYPPEDVFEIDIDWL